MYNDIKNMFDPEKQIILPTFEDEFFNTNKIFNSNNSNIIYDIFDEII